MRHGCCSSSDVPIGRKGSEDQVELHEYYRLIRVCDARESNGARIVLDVPRAHGAGRH
jgi:hypothetical protein